MDPLNRPVALLSEPLRAEIREIVLEAIREAMNGNKTGFRTHYCKMGGLACSVSSEKLLLLHSNRKFRSSVTFRCALYVCRGRGRTAVWNLPGSRAPIRFARARFARFSRLLTPFPLQPQVQ